MRIISPMLARRLAVTRQRLAGEPRPSPGADGILDVVRDLGCLQLDPTSVVARSHLLELLSRLGTYDPAHLDALGEGEAKRAENVQADIRYNMP